MEKLLKLPHRICESTCYVNGLEDIFEWKGAEYMPFLLSVLGGMGEFSYFKFKLATPPNMVYFGANPKYLLDDLEQIMGFKQEIFENRVFKNTFPKIKDFIDKGKPVVIFATPRTCESKVYEKFLKENVKNYIKIPLPQLAYLIENGGDTLSYIKYFKDMIGSDIESGALLCTHYGIVHDDFKKVYPQIKNWIYQEDLIPKYLEEYFEEFPLKEAFFEHGNNLSVLVTKESDVFNKFTKEWFGKDVTIQTISL